MATEERNYESRFRKVLIRTKRNAIRHGDKETCNVCSHVLDALDADGITATGITATLLLVMEEVYGIKCTLGKEAR